MKKVLYLTKVNAKVLAVLNSMGYEVMLCNEVRSAKANRPNLLEILRKNGR